MELGKTVVYQILIMLVIFIIGMICYKAKYITKQSLGGLSTLELDIVNPLLIFMSYQTNFDVSLAKGLGWSFILSVVSFAVAIILSNLLVPNSSQTATLEKFSALYSNCGFMGIPLISGLFGNEGVFYLASYVTMFNLLVWTHGVMLMKGKKDMSEFFKALRSPAVIAVFLGLICFFCRISLPDFAHTSLKYIADMNTPLAMLIAGATAAQTNIIKAAKKISVWRVTALKLFVIPIICYFVIRLFPAPDLVKLTVAIAGACPVATTTVMFAIRFDKDSLTASEFFTFTTVLSGISLPIVAIIAQHFI